MSNDLEILSKIKAESVIYNMSFSNRLSTAETISSVVSIVFTNLGRVPASVDISLNDITFSNNEVQFRISGGEVGERYLITSTVNTSLANIRVGEGTLVIE